MTRLSAAVRASLALASAGMLVLLSTPAPGASFAARKVHHAGPGERVYAAGHAPVPESEPQAEVDAAIADLDAASNQQHYAEQAAALPGANQDLSWKNVGPLGQDDPADYPQGAIRFARNAGMGVAIEADPRDATGNTVYVGNMGGLWHTTDGGKHWANVTDGKLTRTAVGAIALDPANPNNLYVGTGISYLTTSGDAPGSGIWVSHNGGTTFSRPAKNIKGYATNDIAVTPSGVLAATSNGLYKSTDNGASFTRINLPNNATHTGPATGAYANWISAIAVSPLNPNEVIVAVGLGLGKKLGPDGQPLSPGNGLYKSTSGIGGPYSPMPGTAQLTHPAASVDPVGRIMLSWVKTASGDATVLWALVSDAGLASGNQPAGADLVGDTTGQSLNQTNTELNGLYRSGDGGATWDLKATPQSLQSSVNSGLGIYPALGYGIGVQAYYNLWVQGDPRDPNQVYFGLEEVFQSVTPTTSGAGLGDFEIIQRYWDVCGSTLYFDNLFKGASCPDAVPYFGGVSTHPDQHVGLTVKTGSGVRLYTGNDGGFFRQDSHDLGASRNAFDNDNWTELNTLATVQPWKIARKPDGEFLTALQDNGGAFFKPGETSTLVTGGDGVNVVASPDPDTWYLSAQGAFLYVTQDHGKTIRAIKADLAGASFLSPLAIDPTDENHLAVAGRDIHETLKGAATTTTFDPVLGTVVKTDWAQSYDPKNSPYKPSQTADPFPWSAQALALRDTAVYVGICALCRNTLGDPTFVHTTVMTNVKPGCTAKKQSTDCWHTAAGIGLPHNGIWNLAIDPTDVKTIYVVLNNNSQIGYDPKVGGTQRVMVSHDAGEHFSDITGNLPYSHARDIVVRGDKLIVAGDNGVFTGPKTGGKWLRLAKGLPQTRVFDLDLDSTGEFLTASVYGRGVWVLDFKAKSSSSSGPGPKGEPQKPRVSGNGRGMPATGANGALGVIAAALLVVAVGARHVGRRSAA